jgi:hypothetical protein
MTARPMIGHSLPGLADLGRLWRAQPTEADISAAALFVAVLAALDATILWWMTQGGHVWQLALVYAVSGNLTYCLVQGALSRLSGRAGD